MFTERYCQKIRSATRTRSGEPSCVTFATNSVMDCLSLPSFHDGSASAACAMVVAKASAPPRTAASRFCLNLSFIVVLCFAFFGEEFRRDPCSLLTLCRAVRAQSNSKRSRTAPWRAERVSKTRFPVHWARIVASPIVWPRNSIQYKASLIVLASGIPRRGWAYLLVRPSALP
jgi:hypothetical protein